jgi:hypothetical protein
VGHQPDSVARWDAHPLHQRRDRRSRDRINRGFELYTMAVDGSAVVRLTNKRSIDFFPDWQRLS